MSIPSAAVAVAVCIYKGVIDHCDPAAGPIEACRSCHDAASSALRLTRFACPSSSAFRGKKYTDKTAKERSTPKQWRIRRFPGTTGGLVGCGGLSLVYLSTLSLGGATSIE